MILQKYHNILQKEVVESKIPIYQIKFEYNNQTIPLRECRPLSKACMIFFKRSQYSVHWILDIFLYPTHSKKISGISVGPKPIFSFFFMKIEPVGFA